MISFKDVSVCEHFLKSVQRLVGHSTTEVPQMKIINCDLFLLREGKDNQSVRTSITVRPQRNTSICKMGSFCGETSDQWLEMV